MKIPIRCKVYIRNQLNCITGERRVVHTRKDGSRYIRTDSTNRPVMTDDDGDYYEVYYQPIPTHKFEEGKFVRIN